ATAQVVNTLYGKSGVVRSDSWPRLPGTYHGSGCTLASALAAMLANGIALADAAREAQEYTWQALAKAYRPGMGQLIPDRLFWARDEKETRPEDAGADAQRGDARGPRGRRRRSFGRRRSVDRVGARADRSRPHHRRFLLRRFRARARRGRRGRRLCRVRKLFRVVDEACGASRQRRSASACACARR